MLSRVIIQDKEYYSIQKFMELYGLKSRTSIYVWIQEGKAEKKKIGTNSFFRKT